MTRAPLPMLVLLAVLALLLPRPAAAEPSDIAAAARSVVRVVLVSDEDGQYALEGHGSGFAVAPDLIITNAHVVETARSEDHVRIGIVPSEGKSGWFARIVAIAPERDLALLRLTEAGSLPVATLFTGAVADGQDVFAVGYPGNVDLAQGLDVGDIVSPTSPVKTRGNVSSGRSSKAFETILHTAPLGAGNSGGPLLDGCGRVLGANSFGTSFSGGDSEFFFAVSTREIMRFLLAFGVKPRTAGAPCRSMADLDRAEAERVAGDRARSAEAEREAAARRGRAEEQALQRALLEIAEEREKWLGIAGLALLFALGFAGAAWASRERGRTRQAGLLAAGAGVLLVGAGAALFVRPGYDRIHARAQDLLETGAEPSAAPTAAPVASQGALICRLLPERSRVTVSEMADVPLDWSAGGCVNGRTQYALAGNGWTQVLVPDSEDTATVARFDPAAAEYRVERYFLDLGAMQSLRDERRRVTAPACGASEDAARRYGEELGSLRTMLPGQPNERLVYRCSPARGSAAAAD